MKDMDILTVFSETQGQPILKIRRILYVVKGAVTSASGPVELTFNDGKVLLLDAGPDGEALSVKQREWIDYFPEPLSAENRQYVERSGKWTAFDVSDHPPYSDLIAEMVDEITPVQTPEDKIIGATIKTAHCALRAEVESDELFVDIV